VVHETLGLRPRPTKSWRYRFPRSHGPPSRDRLGNGIDAGLTVRHPVPATSGQPDIAACRSSGLGLPVRSRGSGQPVSGHQVGPGSGASDQSGIGATGHPASGPSRTGRAGQSGIGSVGPVSGRPGNPESGRPDSGYRRRPHRELGRRPASGACPPVRYRSDWAIRHRGDRTAGIGGVWATGIRACISARDRGIRSVRYWGGRTSDLGGVRVIRCPNVQVSLVQGASRRSGVGATGQSGIGATEQRVSEASGQPGIRGSRSARDPGVRVSPESGRPGQSGIGATGQSVWGVPT
jgi:hypothetical protein